MLVTVSLSLPYCSPNLTLSPTPLPHLDQFLAPGKMLILVLAPTVSWKIRLIYLNYAVDSVIPFF